MVHLDYRDSRPIYAQIVDGFREQITGGVLRPGEKLPSVRDLAAQLAINPNTIQRAYRRLEAEGWIATVPGKGCFVCGDGEIREREKKRLLLSFDEAAAALRISGGEQSMLPGSKMPVLTSAEIAKVVGKASGVPAERVGEAERVRLDQLEARLAAQVIGQPRAVHAVAAAIRRSRTGLREAGRPIGAMLFLGPTGVGKTQLARTLAQSWFGSEKALLRFDMSEYMEQHTVARLIGAPPGYVGHDEGGQLTEAVRRRPYSVVLFDEIEKAHSDIQNILLQILEDGTLTDAQGRKADFSNTIILLTSNLGARCLAGQASPLGFGAAAEETARRGQKALQEAKDYFRPELMGRLDDVVLFDPLGPAQLAAIADRLLCELEERAARQGYTLRHTPAAAAALAGDTVPAYGARELRRKVSRAVEQALADRIAAGTARPGVLFVADAAPDGHITLTIGDVAACAS